MTTATTEATFTQAEACTFVANLFNRADDWQNFFANVTAEAIVSENQFTEEDVPLFAKALTTVRTMIDAADFESDEFSDPDELPDLLEAIYSRAWDMIEIARWMGDDLTSGELGEWMDEATAKENLRESPLVRVVSIRSWFNGNHEQDVLYFARRADVEELRALCEKKYKLTCCYMGMSQESEFTEQEGREGLLWPDYSGDLCKCDGTDFYDPSGSAVSGCDSPADWNYGRVTESGCGPWRYNDIADQNMIEVCSELCTRAGLGELVIATDAAGDPDYTETFSEEGPNAARIAALDTAEWKCEDAN